MSISITINKDYKSIKACSFELPEFCIITGKNGSGKSHLLEIIKERETAVFIKGELKQNIKYIAFNQLVPRIATNGNPAIANQYINTTWDNFKEFLRQNQNFKDSDFNQIGDSLKRQHVFIHDISQVNFISAVAKKQTKT